MNILIIEDNYNLAKNIKRTFEKQIISNRVKTIYSYDDFINELWIINSYDIILVDIELGSLNQKNWIDIIKIVREKEINIPIVVMSSFSDYSWIEKAFDSWSNDYLIKPLRLKELEIRIQKWFKTHLYTIQYLDSDIISYKNLHYNFKENNFYYGKQRINLTKKSKYLLTIFISSPEKLFTENLLIEKIWWDISITENRNLRINILRLKESLKLHWIDNWIQNIRWEWYILKKS